MTPGQFKKRVGRIKEYIRAGDIIQAVYSQRFDLGTMEDSFVFYRILRSLNPSPYMYFFKHRDLEIAGSSPELLVRKKGNLAGNFVGNFRAGYASVGDECGQPATGIVHECG